MWHYGEGVYPVIKGYQWVPYDPKPIQVRESAPHVSTPAAEVKDWRADLPTVALSPASVKLVKMLKEGMRGLTDEHFLAVGIDRYGEVCFEDWQSDHDPVHANVDVGRIVAQARESQAQGVCCYHNHPNGDLRMSDPDKQLTKLIERRLAAEGKSLLEHGIVPGNPDRIREAQTPRMLTSWDVRNAEDRRLWGAGGPPPVPWARWSQRQTESELLSEYPRDTFDVQSLTDALEEAARDILHSVPPDVARRIVQTVAQRLGVQA